ncbi:MAG: aspartate/glutamate racemase family protein [Patescibacteria group bacterium]
MIGIFDSGSGGLTVLKALRAELPSADVVYFGDIANAPYGSKSRAELSRLTAGAFQLLKAQGVNKIISACNSVSASLAVSLYDAFSIAPGALIEMVGPTVSYFKGSKARIGLCATPATIDSGIYQDAFRMMGIEITSIAISDLAGAIEFGGDTDAIIQNTFSTNPTDFDVLILACTHYPLAIDVFKKALPGVMIFDPAAAVAERARAQFWPQEVGDGTTRFIISKDSEIFRGFVAQLFPEEKVTIEVQV